MSWVSLASLLFAHTQLGTQSLLLLFLGALLEHACSFLDVAARALLRLLSAVCAACPLELGRQLVELLDNFVLVAQFALLLPTHRLLVVLLALSERHLLRDVLHAAAAPLKHLVLHEGSQLRALSLLLSLIDETLITP